MSGGWVNAWPLLLILAIGIGLGRWIERRRWKAIEKRREATLAALKIASDDLANLPIDSTKPRRKP